MYYFFLFFPGSTECQILSAIEDIVDKSLPSSKLAAHFKDNEAFKICILNYKYHTARHDKMIQSYSSLNGHQKMI